MLSSNPCGWLGSYGHGVVISDTVKHKVEGGEVTFFGDPSGLDTENLARDVKKRIAEWKPQTLEAWAETVMPGMWMDEVTKDEVVALLEEFRKWVKEEQSHD